MAFMLFNLPAKILIICKRACKAFLMVVLRRAFRGCGKNVRFDPYGVYSYKNIIIGDNVYIGTGATFIAAETGIFIGNKVLFGPNVTIVGGDHNVYEIGRFMFDVKNKRPEDDQMVVIEDDVWVGAGATILKGVHLGRGCIVAANAVVTKNTPPYVIVGGIPAKVMRYRFDVETILQHESKIYPPNKRLSIQSLLKSGNYMNIKSRLKRNNKK